MQISLMKLPNMSTYMKNIQLFQLGSETTIIAIFKSSVRDENIFVDIYKNDISDTNKILSGKIITLNSCLYAPNRMVDFPYYINCYDIDGIGVPLNQDTLHNFYFQFSSYDDGHIIDTDTESEV